MSLLLTQGNALRIPLADESVHCIVCSPPYWGLRDYGIGDQLGLEPTPEQYVANMVEVFREVKRVLRSDGTVWLNLGDSYASSSGTGHGGWDGNNKNPDGSARRNRQAGDKWLSSSTAVGGLKPKDLCGIPWRVAFALQADGWWLRSDIIWDKPNPMPESVTDRPTKSHEYLFLLTKSARYYYDQDAVREGNKRVLRSSFRGTDGYTSSYSFDNSAERPKPDTGSQLQEGIGRNRRTVWHIATAPYSGAHFATYPPALVEPCIKAGTSERGVCPECGAPWERVVKRNYPECRATVSRDIEGKTRQGKLGTKRFDDPILINTLGWQPTCECIVMCKDRDGQHHWKVNCWACEHEGEQHDPVPATLFDPFAGSGTTLQVARALGRNGVGLDLSLEYLHLARQRLSLDALDAWNEGVGTNDNGKDTAHKNKQVPRQVHSFHAARNEKGVTDLPMFEEL